MRFSCLLAFLVCCLSPVFAAGPFAIDNYQFVSSQRVTLTKYDVTYSASLMNSGAAQPAVSATLTSLDPSIQVVPGHDTLNFAPVPANSQTPSSNTFTILVDRTVAFDFSKLQWTFQSAPAPPVANAGQNQKAAIGSTVTLDGSASTNPSGVGMLTYSFAFTSRPAGSNAVLMNANTVSPSFVVDVAGNYVVTLTVSNGVASSTANVTISTVSTPPVANAGPNQTVTQGSTVTLDGSKSTDPDGNPLTFAFTLTSRPAGSTATLSNANTASPTFVADKPGQYIAQLVVSDKNGSSTNQASVTITTTPTPPVANAGPSQSVKVGSTVQLDGSGSTDVNGFPLTYQFKFNSVPPGSNAVLSNPNSVNPTFVVDQPGTYVVQLIVNDGVSSSAPSTVSISTNAVQAPTANAGPDQRVSVNSVVTLNGSGTDPQGLPLTFSFALTTKPAGSNATLTNPNTQNPTFIPDLPGQYIAQLTVSNGFKTATSTVNITTTAPAPVANAGQNQTVTAGSTVTLDGSGSSDASHFPLTYSFVLLSKPPNSNATLSGATTVAPSFIADQVGMYVVQLIVNDGFNSSQPVTVTINAVAGSPGSVTATGGTSQTAAVGTAFASPLSVTVKDSGGNPVSGVTVTFTLPTTGAGAAFAGNANTAVTNASGVATSAALTANNTAGKFTVTATVPNVGTPANFSLTNTAGAAAAITATGTPAPTAAGTAFANPLVATVKDSLGNPVSGVTVTFTAPASGASGTFAGGVNTAVTDASGNATSAVFTANNTAGTFTVSASAPGVATAASFTLISNAGGASTIAATSGTPQSAPINTAFATPLSVTVKDSLGNPVSGVTVTFAAPATGASVTFAGGNTAVTNASGVATSGVFTANGATGAYTVNATAPGVGTPAAFTLTNTAGAPATIAASGGTPQSALTNAAFATPLSATVKDAGGNPVGGVTVTFNAPASGAGGTFAGGNTAVTNASGVATSGVFTANGTAGTFTVTATAPGVSAPATFSLTNNAPPPASVTATAGSGQSANVSTAFASPLSATVLDAQQHPVAGITVTFTAPGSGASGTFANGTATTTAVTNGSGVATSSVFTANATAGAFMVTGAVAGVNTPATFSLTNTPVVQTGPPITIGGGAVGQNLQIQVPITLGGTPPSGSVSITVTSSDPANLLVSARATSVGAASATVVTVAGTATTAIFVQALGSNANVTLTAMASGFMNGTSTVAVTPSGFTLASPNGVGTSFTTNQGSSTQLTVTATRLDSSLNPVETQSLRAGFSTSVAVTPSDMTIATVTPSPVNFAAGSNTATTQLVAGNTNMGNVTVTAVEPTGFSTPAGGANTLLVTVQPSGITCASTSVGFNLETLVNCTLQGAAPAGGLMVSITSSDPTKLLLSGDRTGTTLGTGSITVKIPAGLSSTGDFFVQGLASSGSVTYTAMASGFGTSTGTITLTPSGFTFTQPAGGTSFFANTGGGPTDLIITPEQLDSSGAVVTALPIRGGFSPTVNFTSSMPAFGTVTPASVTFNGGDFTAQTEFNPLSPGNTDITVTGPSGFGTPSGGLNVVTAMVSTPRIKLSDPGSVGKNTEVPGTLQLPQQAGPGGLVVTFTSNSSSLLISDSPDTLGSTTKAVTVPEGKNNVKFFLQALSDTGSVSYTASSSGFQSSTSTVTLTPSGVEIGGAQGPAGAFTTKLSSGPVTITVDLAQLASDGSVLNSGQALIPGMSLQVNLSSSMPGVGTVTPAQVTIASGLISGNGRTADAQFNPVAVGSTVVSAVAATPGFTAAPAAVSTVKFTVTP